MSTPYWREGEVLLEDNHLAGPIPPKLVNLRGLAAVHREGNELGGAVPATPRTSPISRGSRPTSAGTGSARATRLWGAFLDSKQIGHDWERSQTVTPTSLVAGHTTLDTVSLPWSPIRYTPRDSGEDALAREVARRFCETVRLGGPPENFDAVTGAPLCDPPYTWTSSVILVLAHEYLAE